MKNINNKLMSIRNDIATNILVLGGVVIRTLYVSDVASTFDDTRENNLRFKLLKIANRKE